VAGTCECGNEPSVSIKSGGISLLAENRGFLKKDSAAWGLTDVNGFLFVLSTLLTDLYEIRYEKPALNTVGNL
jgi:hypothetical protein